MLTVQAAARMSPEDRAYLAEYAAQVVAMQKWRCDILDCDGKPHPGRDWPHARASQVPPFLRPVHQQPTYLNRRERRYFLRWYARAGRRWGKTWAGARALAECIATQGGYDANGTARHWWVVGTKWDYTIKVLLESPSGLIAALGGFDGPMLADRRTAWNKSEGVLTLKNGAKVIVSSAHDGGIHLQGLGYSGGWADEVGLWNRHQWETTWEDSILTSTAVDPGYIIVTGTPKQGHPLVARLLSDPEVHQVLGGTKENTSLSADWIRRRYEQLAGTRRALQELDGAYLEDVDGAVWTATLIEATRRALLPVRTLGDFDKIVVSWDPAGSNEPGSDEHGVIVVGMLKGGGGEADRYYVLHDGSMNGSPTEVARHVTSLFHQWQATEVVLETNYGAKAFPEILHSVDSSVPCREVHAPSGYGKTRRAEGAVSLYETGVVHHVGEFAALEQQMTTWTPESSGSPDRMDALVWALLSLSGLGDRGKKSTGYVFTFTDDDF